MTTPGMTVLRKAMIAGLVAMLPALEGCARRGEPVDQLAEEPDQSAQTDVLVETAVDEEDLAPPTLSPPIPAGPGVFPGPPFRPPAAPPPPGSFPTETVPPPAAIPDGERPDGAESSSSTSSDADAGLAAPGELLEPSSASAAPSVGAAPLSRARLFRRYDEWTEAETAADALGRIGAAAAPEVTAMLADPDPAVRRQAAEILARIGPEAEMAIEPLMRVLEEDSDRAVRKAAAYALGQMGPKAAAAAPVLLRILREAK